MYLFISYSDLFSVGAILTIYDNQITVCVNAKHRRKTLQEPLEKGSQGKWEDSFNHQL